MAKQTKKVAEKATEKAINLFLIGFVAEFYLLMIDRFYIEHGTATQVLAMLQYLKIASFVGLGLFVIGLLAFYLVKGNPTVNRLSVWGVGIGAFLAVSSGALLRFPSLLSAFTITVPVVMLLGIAFLLYERAFFVEALGLTAALYAAVFLHRGATAHVKIGTAVIVAVLLALLVLSVVAKGHKGKIGKLAVFPRDMNYTMLFAVLFICLLTVLGAFFFPIAAYYLVWTLAIITFLLSVYYTVRIL